MAKGMYKVAVIRSSRESEYRDFWNRNIKRGRNGEILDSESVGIYEYLEAKNLNEAISIIQKKHPSLTIARDHSCKVG